MSSIKKQKTSSENVASNGQSQDIREQELGEKQTDAMKKIGDKRSKRAKRNPSSASESDGGSESSASTTEEKSVVSTTTAVVDPLTGRWIADSTLGSLTIGPIGADGTFTGTFINDTSAGGYELGTHPVKGQQDVSSPTPAFYLSIQWVDSTTGLPMNSFTSFSGKKRPEPNLIDVLWSRIGADRSSELDFFRRS